PERFRYRRGPPPPRVDTDCSADSRNHRPAGACAEQHPSQPDARRAQHSRVPVSIPCTAPCNSTRSGMEAARSRFGPREDYRPEWPAPAHLLSGMHVHWPNPPHPEFRCKTSQPLTLLRASRRDTKRSALPFDPTAEAGTSAVAHIAAVDTAPAAPDTALVGADIAPAAGTVDTGLAERAPGNIGSVDYYREDIAEADIGPAQSRESLHILQ